MSKPVRDEVFELLKGEIVESKMQKKDEFFMQILALLENLKQGDNAKLFRISSELSELLSNEKAFKKIEKARNLEELLCVLDELNKNNKMLKIYSTDNLKLDFPTLAENEFLK